MTITVLRVIPEHWQHLRAVRLIALAESPQAFGQTLAQAFAMLDADWQERCRLDATGAERACFIAWAQNDPVGMAGTFLQKDDPRTCAVWGMWTSPRVRRQGIGTQLLRAAEDWARAAGATRLTFWVSDANAEAAAFYRGQGYAPTGATSPMSSDPQTLAQLYARELNSA
jgi:GNAT superfamily N-acetyltransferase